MKRMLTMGRRRTVTSAGKNLEVMPDSGGHYIFCRIMMIMMLCVVVALPCLVLYNAANPSQFLRLSSHAVDVDSSSDSEQVRLERILKAASMDDKTIILTTLNEAWAAPNSIFDLFLESFQIGDGTKKLLNHLVVIALDQKAYKRCLDVHSHCFALTTEGVDFSVEAYFMSRDYLKMMWKRIDFLRTILEMRYNFIFTDADIMWFRNPLKRFYKDTDFQISCDNYALNNSYDLNNMPNGGFNYVISNNRTIQFYKFWYDSRNTFRNKHDQAVLMLIKHDPFIKKIGLKIRFLDTSYFGGFCEPSKNLNEVCTMHANCCFGLDTKIHDLRLMLEDWRKFVYLAPSVKSSWNSTWRVPQNCSLASFDRHYLPKKQKIRD